MRYILLVLLIVAFASSNATLEKLLKQESDSQEVGIPPLFPKNFIYPSIQAGGADASWSGYAKFDGGNNIISVNGTGYNV